MESLGHVNLHLHRTGEEKNTYSRISIEVGNVKGLVMVEDVDMIGELSCTRL